MTAFMTQLMETMVEILGDDKNLVILCATLIALVSFIPDVSTSVAENALSGLFGLAIGRASKSAV